MRNLLLVLCCGVVSFSTVTSQSFTDLDPNNLPTPVDQPITNAAMIPTSGAVFYTDQTMFMDDCGNLISSTTEDFEDNLLTPNAIGADLFPLNNLTNDLNFALGSIEAGVEIDGIVFSPSINDYVVVTTGAVGVINDAVGPNTFGDDMVLNFSVPTNLVSFNLSDPLNAGDFIVEVFGTSGSLGSSNVLAAGTAGVFVGILAAEDIERVEIRDNVVSSSQLIYDVSFGVCSGQVIPTMGEWGIIILSISLSIFALVAIRNRKYIFG